MFYLSSYLEEHRDTYYDQLLSISRDGDWTGWCRFFLGGVRNQADENFERAHAILRLHEAYKPLVVEWTRSQFATAGLEQLFHRPIFKSTDFMEAAAIPAPTARRLLRSFEENGLIYKVKPARGKTPAMYSFPELMKIVDGSR